MNLRDGYLQMQRVFHFDTANCAESFRRRIRDKKMISGIELSVHADSLADFALLVSLDFLPDHEMLATGGRVAAACDREYSQQLDLARSAA